MRIDLNLLLLLIIILLNQTKQQNAPAAFCRLFSQNNRPVYECINAWTLQQLPAIPSGTMILRVINASINTLTAIKNTDIVSIILNYCNISDILPNAFDYATNLRRLDLSHNLLNIINFKNSKSSIEELILSYNYFKNTPNISYLKNLKILDLSNNQINSIKSNSLLSPRLEIINLSSNNLTNVKKYDFGDTVRIVKLDKNLWNCDCHLREFIKFQRQTLIAESAKCHDPLTIRNVKWDDLMINDFACGPVIQGESVEKFIRAESDSIQFDCIAWGDPKPNLSWTTNQSKDAVTFNDRIQIKTVDDINSTVTRQILEIRDVKREDEGSYWCKASTAFNIALKQYTVNIVGGSPTVLNEREIISKKPRLNEMTSTEENFITKGPIWKMMLIIVVVLAFTLFFIACCVFFAYLNKTKNKQQLRENIKEEKIDETRCLPEEFEIVSNDLDGDEIRTSLVRTPSSPILDMPIRKTDDWSRKAPLAQQDRDTSLLPLVQTSL